MKIPMRVVLIGLIALLLGAATPSTAIDITWGTSSGRLRDGGSTNLPGSSYLNGYDYGTFAQLIYAGLNGVPEPLDPAQNDGIAPTSDDEVKANAWMGKGIFPPSTQPPALGRFSTLDSVTAASNDVFYIRFFDSITPDWANKTIPASGLYNDVSGFVVSSSMEQTGSGVFAVGGLYDTVVEVIPEPGSLALLGAGLLLLGARRKKRWR